MTAEKILDIILEISDLNLLNVKPTTFYLNIFIYIYLLPTLFWPKFVLKLHIVLFVYQFQLINIVYSSLLQWYIYLKGTCNIVEHKVDHILFKWWLTWKEKEKNVNIFHISLKINPNKLMNAI